MKSNLFNHTQWRLAVVFTSFLIVFLLSFILITYFSLLSIVTVEQKEEAISLAKKEWRDHRYDLLEYQFKPQKDERNKDNSFFDSLEYNPNARTFYYIVAADGTLIDGDETHPEIRQTILVKMKDWLPQESDVKQMKVVLEDDSIIHILLSGRTIYEHGQYVGTIYTGINITEEIEIIQTLLLILIVLSVLFIIVSILLGYWMAGRAMIPISTAFNRQKDFTADASHELRTPLSIMQSSLEVIDAEDREKLSTFSMTILDDLKDEVKRMSHLVNDLLVLARSDVEGDSFKKEWFSLTTILEKLQRNFKYEARKQGVDLQLTLPNEIEAFGDEEKITQLLYIVVDNAIKYNKRNGFVKTAVSKEKGIIKIKIMDSGVGIPLDQQKRIFDRFYRVDKARSRDSGSNGIGLSIADWIARTHKGSLDVYSEEGKGSTFTINLPLPALKQWR